METKPRYLLTGFEPFAGDYENPTETLLKWVRRDRELSSFFDTQLLPVVFSEAPKKILDRDDLSSFSGLIHLGLAAGRSKISLERVALNWIETSIADNSGQLPTHGPIRHNGEKALFTKGPLEPLRKNLREADVPVEISLSAGGYVCNFLYYRTLEAQLKPWVLFIHVPYLKDQVAGRAPEPPSLQREQFHLFLNILMMTLKQEDRRESRNQTEEPN
jgi:pyroglutamyl-peptidase